MKKAKKTLKTRTTQRRDILAATAFAVLLAVLGLVAALADGALLGKKTDNTSSAETVTLEGSLGCAPLKKSDDTTDKRCKISIKTSSNEYYAINGATATTGDNGSTIKLAGVLVPAAVNEPYDIKGTLTAQ